MRIPHLKSASTLCCSTSPKEYWFEAESQSNFVVKFSVFKDIYAVTDWFPSLEKAKVPKKLTETFLRGGKRILRRGERPIT